jgi:hydrogenase maturation factor
MRRVAPHKRALVKAGNEAARKLVKLVGRCEWCDRNYVGFGQHEIANGSYRLKARLEPFAVLVLCGECHVQIHRMPKPEQQHICLAILYHARTADYDLQAFNMLVNPRAPNRITQYEVDLWIARLTRHA